MNSGDEKGTADAAEEAMLIVQITKALYAHDIDEIFRILGRYLDKHRFQVSADVMREFEVAGRIKQS